MPQHPLPVLDFPVRELHTAKRGFEHAAIPTETWLRWRQIRQNTRRPALSRLPKRLETHNLARP
ncbi:MAG: hypothetical protein ACRD3G_14560 [Vicinamibacterales bacterium]